MHALLSGFLYTTWGVFIISAVDSSLFFFLPFAVDVGVILTAARHPDFFWLYALIFSAASLLGAATTYYLGKRIGEAELERFISGTKAKEIIKKVRKKGAVALAALDLIPPPFPFTAFILTAGALEVRVKRFFVAMFAFRVLRFGGESLLAVIFGTQVVRFIESPTAHLIAEIFTAIIVAGSIVSVLLFIRQIRRPSGRRRKAA